ncbi:sensor histidine kinase [Mycobacterium sp. SMC-8]|uniref:sensor histidine kinase n=1 Tax=Mycobacterium sp. SMC-8 TaxID=2857060 RepID=UPI0037C91DE4
MTSRRSLRRSVRRSSTCTADRRPIPRLRQRLDGAVAAFPGSGIRASVQSAGPLSVVNAAPADHAEAIVREAVSNAVRHSGSTVVAVTIAVDDDLVIDVRDDGRGIGADVTGSGLANLAQRARDAGGSFAVQPVPEGGTVLTWRAPLP